MPPSACSNMPTLVSLAPVNAPRTWPNSSLSNSVSTTAEQLSGMKRRAWRGPSRVQRLGDQLLAGAGLAGDQHGAHVRRQAADRIEQLLHRRAPADHALELALLGDLGVDRHHQLAATDALPHLDQQLAQRSKSSGLVR